MTAEARAQDGCDAHEGLIVTNYHVVNAGTIHRVNVGDGFRSARVLSAAPCDDLALLQLDDHSGLSELPLGEQDKLQQGAEVVALGYPRNLSSSPEFISTTGSISLVRMEFDAPRYPHYPNVIRTQVPINPGNSGGPLLDMTGHVVGVNFGYGPRSQNESYSIGIDRVKDVVKVLRTKQSLAWTGMEWDEESVGGLQVVRAMDGSPAAKAGFGQRPWTVTAVNGTRVQSVGDYCGAAGGVSSGQTATFTVDKGDGTPVQDVEVKFL